MRVAAQPRGPGQLLPLRSAAGGPRLVASLPGSRCRAALHRPTNSHTSLNHFPWMLKHRHPSGGHAKEGPSLQTCNAELSEGAGPNAPSGWWSNVPSKALFVSWLAITGYAFFLSPNQAASTDMSDAQRLLGILKDDVKPNPVFAVIFNLIGVYFPIYAGLLIPSGRSKNKIPLWPFVLTSFFLGSYALMPYFALWQPDPEIVGPPRKTDITGWKRIPQRLLESRLFWLFNTCCTLYICRLLLAPTAAYRACAGLFFKSRLVHGSTLDFVLLYAFIPFWMSNDAGVRGWNRSPSLLTFLKFLPVLGPLIYMLLRPGPQ